MPPAILEREFERFASRLALLRRRVEDGAEPGELAAAWAELEAGLDALRLAASQMPAEGAGRGTAGGSIESRLLRAEQVENIGHLAAGIAHDLNNALAPVMLVAPLLRAEITTAAGHSLVDLAETSARHGREVVKQVLAFASPTDAEQSTIQSRHLAREIVQLAQESWPAQIRLKANLPRDLQPVNGNATALHYALLQLCLHARDAMPLGGVLTLAGQNAQLEEPTARPHPGVVPGPYVLWTIAHTGASLPPEELGRIFEPYGLAGAAGKASGTALFTVARIVQRHGGFIEAHNGEGSGLQFKLWLPAARASGARTPEPAHPAAPRGNGECILVVDDEESVRQPVRLTLEGWGYRVLNAADGMEALGVFNGRHADVRLVLTDVMMPRLGGLRLVEAVHQIAPGLPTILMTGVSDDSTRADARRLRVSGFLAKPFERGQLLEAIHTALAATPEGN